VEEEDSVTILKKGRGVGGLSPMTLDGSAERYPGHVMSHEIPHKAEAKTVRHCGQQPRDVPRFPRKSYDNHKAPHGTL
jgi:hypothetical protein